MKTGNGENYKNYFGVKRNNPAPISSAKRSGSSKIKLACGFPISFVQREGDKG